MPWRMRLRLCWELFQCVLCFFAPAIGCMLLAAWLNNPLSFLLMMVAFVMAMGGIFIGEGICSDYQKSKETRQRDHPTAGAKQDAALVARAG